jgi:hypothetical protein
MPWALDPQEILQIAQEAVRQRGYVTYPDYEGALRQAIMDGRLRAVDAGWEHHNIREKSEHTPLAEKQSSRHLFEF